MNGMAVFAITVALREMNSTNGNILPKTVASKNVLNVEKSISANMTLGDWGCVCIRCHEKSNLGLPNHKWTYLNGCTEICEICGRKREEHEWVYFKEDSCEQKCSKCGKLSSYENHEKWQPMDGCKMKCSRCGEITEDIQAHDWETIEEHIDRGGNGYIYCEV
jgi:hypothetical protein